MRAVRIHKFGGGPRDLVYEENVLQPHPKEGEVLVKVYATGVTQNEINWIWYNSDISLPISWAMNFQALYKKLVLKYPIRGLVMLYMD